MISLKCWVPLFVTSAAMMTSASAGETFAPVLSDADAWAKLPKAIKGGGQPLPSWARMMAADLPRTTAALLQLDDAQLTKSPVDPKLRAAMRWVAAHANKSPYDLAYAESDALRAEAASMALLLAYSNFQDRLLLCLGAAVEPNGPLSPLGVAFEPAATTSRTTPPLPRQKTALPKPTGKDLVEDSPEWTATTYANDGFMEFFKPPMTVTTSNAK